MESEEIDSGDLYQRTKKRKSHGRMAEVMKKIRLSSHEGGLPCNCKQKCFQRISPDARRDVLQNFNMLPSHDVQNSYLCGLISVLPVNRRSKNPSAMHYDAVYQYRIRAMIDSDIKELRICKKAFMAIHGITKKKVEYLLSSLKSTGIAPTDKRGRHGHQPKLCSETKSLIRQHINSFKGKDFNVLVNVSYFAHSCVYILLFFAGRTSHYSLHDSSRIYLPEELNIKKMYKMFIDYNKNNDTAKKISYETYRNIFNNDFNIAFGYPRTDTCSTCDQFKVKLDALQLEIKAPNDLQHESLLKKDILKLSTEKKLHLLKAQTFYTRKRLARIYSTNSSHITESICIDYGKNLSVPNIQTNDVYYRRQLTVNAFNIHVLNSKKSIFYLYPETEGKKGSDDVCSLVHHFIYNFMTKTTKHLRIFCDSCSGQNKNFTMFRFLYHVVHVEKKLDSVMMTFPVRGHSYLENDKNMGLIKYKKAKAEIPDDWVEIFECARQKPFPFDVVKVDKGFFKAWTQHLEQLYAKKSTFPSRPIKELKIQNTSKKLIFRNTYNGAWEEACITGRRKGKNYSTITDNEFLLPGPSYFEDIPISKEKYEDLQVLKKFCGIKAQEYFTNIIHK